MLKKLIAISAVLAAVSLVLPAQADKKEKKDGLANAKCPVSGKPINKDASVEYKGGKLYFCCPGCPSGFAKNTEKFAAKANQQLYQTGQAKLVKCPLTGRKLNPATKISVAGTDVCFCCNNCKGKVSKAEGDAQRDLVFSDKAFKKGFTVGKKKKE